jgi:glycosyltransferase involved in cell wall biosynthesis
MRLLLFNLATDADDPILGFTTGWINALARRVESVDVLTMRAGRLTTAPNVRVHSVGKEKGYSEPRRAAEFYRLLFRILRSARPEACFSHMMPLFTAMAGPVLRWKKIPVVTWYAHPSLTTTLKVAHFFSDKMVASLPTAYPYKRDKLEVIGQGIDSALFAPDGSPPAQPPVILYAGRLSPVKDIETLLRATVLLRQEYRQPFHVVILGGPATAADQTYAARLREFVLQNALEDVVRFEPPCPRAELPRWFNQCWLHVNLTPSGFGDKVAFEAMSCGRPCLVANRDFDSLLGPYAPELIFSPGDAEELCARLRRVLGWSTEQHSRCGEYLRKEVKERHSLEGLADRIVRLLKEAQKARAEHPGKGGSE